jgi:excisionase family DNA binding protein
MTRVDSDKLSGQAEMLSIDEICQLLDCHRSTIKRWIRHGQFPVPLRRAGQVKRWRRRAVLDFVECKRYADAIR